MLSQPQLIVIAYKIILDGKIARDRVTPYEQETNL